MTEATVDGDSCDAFALAAAERIAEIRSALRAFLREHADPAQALTCLNNFVCDAQRLGQRDDSAFTTLTLAVMDGTSDEMI